MRAALLLWCFVVAQTLAQGNKDYLDQNLRPVDQDKSTYYREVENPDDLDGPYRTKTYYNSGKLFQEASFSERKLYYRNGPFTEYHENGNVKARGTFDKNRLVGRYETWYESGAKRSEEEYAPHTMLENITNFKVLNFWDGQHEQTVTDGNGSCEITDENFGDIASGTIKNGVKDGKWTGHYRRNPITYEEIYADGKLLSGVTTDEKGKKFAYTEVLQHPKPKKGINHFYQYIAENFRMPRETKSGRILVRFVIGKDGDATDLNIVESLGEDYDKEAIRVIKRYPDWESGFYRGMPIRLEYAIPIKIQG